MIVTGVFACSTDPCESKDYLVIQGWREFAGEQFSPLLVMIQSDLQKRQS